jgi:acyl carrier protein
MGRTIREAAWRRIVRNANAPRPRVESTGARHETMDKGEIENRVKKVISSVLNVKATEVKSTSNFVFDLGADSKQSVELVAAFEEEFEIEMDQDQALGVQSVGDAVSYIAGIVNK